MSDQQASIPILELDDISARIPLLEKIGTDVLKLIQRRDEILGQTRSPGRGVEEKSPTLVELKEELRTLSRKLEAYRELRGQSEKACERLAELLPDGEDAIVLPEQDDKLLEGLDMASSNASGDKKEDKKDKKKETRLKKSA